MSDSITTNIRFMLDTIPFPSAYIDKDQRYCFQNQGHQNWFEDVESIIVGQPIREVVGESTYQLFKPHIQLVLQGRPVVFEASLLKSQGHAVYARIHFLPHLDPNGGMQGFFVLIDDITQKKQAEELRMESERRFRIMADHAPVMLWMSGIDAMCNFFNQWWLTFTGRTLEEEMGNGWAEGVHHEDLQSCLNTYLKAFNERREFVMEYRLRRADGEYRWIRDHGTPRFTPDGSFAGFIGSCVDITEHKEAERELLNAHKTAVEASQLKSEFMANVSHEIRTPLNGIIGMTEILEHSTLTKKQREDVDLIKLSADTLLAVVNSVLDFSKIESGQLDLDLSDFNLSDAVAEMVKLFSYSLKKKGIALDVRTAPDIPDLLIGDSTRIKQVLKNMLDNAIKFTDEGTIAIDVKKKTEDAKQVTLLIGVTDTGIGISVDAQARLFKPFSQGDNSFTRKYGGTGLGLVICKRLMELMGGEIGFESRPGEGSTFWIQLTLQRKLASERKTKTANRRKNPGHRVKKRPHVLIVEDNQINQKVLKEMLKRIGCKPESVDNGEEAIRMLGKNEYDLVLMDCQMPGMNGFVATSEIRKSENQGKRRIPIIALTAHAIEGDREKCLKADMDDYISKPVDFAILTETVEKWLK